MKTIQVTVSGIVQGVGFRPFVYTLAKTNGLTGRVWNTSSGVEITLSGSSENIESFLETLKNNPPPLARIDKVEEKSQDFQPFTDFEIVESLSVQNSFVPVSPDISICDDCRRELFDPNDRRFRYPFINCTNCGPRLTIIKDIPYDRPKTTMSEFALCPDCASEYKDPSNRRFHAQPVACPNCGPKITFHSSRSRKSEGENALQQAREYLRNGKIIAVKGLGGYHIACDASNESSVATLITKKHRSQKPLALMAFDLDYIRKYCLVSPEEEQLLSSIQHPIVLLQKKPGISLPDQIAINQKTLGFMLPYTPLHLLLLEPEVDFPEVLVMTSGNLADEPIAYKDDDAIERLSPIVDGFLVHNREINIRVDDSVLRVFENSSYFVRRSRGFAPEPIRINENLPDILACGAELKNTFSLSKSKYVFISHHIGDLENYETLQSFENGINHYQKLFRVSPQIIAADLHPDYLSTKYAIERAESTNTQLIRVQHHHAHLAACLADNNFSTNENVIGCIFDGTGYGSDGKIWGGEILTGSFQEFTRTLHLNELPLPGGNSSIKNPAKIAISYLHEADIELGNDLPPVNEFSSSHLSTIISQVKTGINSPLTTSMGRLFDAVASILGIRQSVSYEAQAAIELENLCDPDEKAKYSFELSDKEINVFPMLRALVYDFRSGIGIDIIASKFHNTVAHVCLEACSQIRRNTGLSIVALSGGVWQNVILLKKTNDILLKNGFRVLIHRQVPANDGGVSLGQLMIAAHSTFV